MTSTTAEPRMRPFKQMDVFTSVPYVGNPVAVVLDGRGLSLEAMQLYARWTNLSETTFVLPPENPQAHYRVRIFTTTREILFAGHPTLGTCKAWLDNLPPSSLKTLLSKSNNKIIQECGIGLVPISVDPSTSRLSFSAPSFLREGPVSELSLKRAYSILGLEMHEVLASNWIDNGPGWFCLVLESAEAVRRIKPKFPSKDGPKVGEKEENGHFGVVGPYRKGKKLFIEKGLIAGNNYHDAQNQGIETGDDDGDDEPHFEVRAFAVDKRLEDPVTGSFNAGVARFLISKGLAPNSYVSQQGTELGRRGKIYIRKVEEKNENGEDIIWVGGDVCTCIEGKVLI